MLLYGWAVIPLMYPLNYLFEIPSTAFVAASSMNVFIGIVSTMTTSVIDSLNDDDLAQINEILKPVFTILFPHYCLGQGFITMTTLYNTKQANSILGIKGQYDPFLFKNVGRNLLALTIQGVVFFIFNLLVQYKFFVHFKPTQNVKKLNLKKSENPDSDVLAENLRILTNEENRKQNRNALNKRTMKNQISSEDITRKESNTDVNEAKDYIKLVNLTKVFRKFKKFRYKKHAAVNDLSLGINKGECFGLIGVNGAGIKQF